MADNRPKKILVAENTDSNFLLVSIILRKEYTVLRAYNGIEAIDVYKKEQPDLILMDIKMPEMDWKHPAQSGISIRKSRSSHLLPTLSTATSKKRSTQAVTTTWPSPSSWDS